MQADLILLDLHLPDMSGEDVLQQMAQDPSLRHIPVIVLTADATSQLARRLEAAGAMAYLTKPVEVAKLLRLLDEVLGEREAEVPDLRAG
jgi:CheY-like chemotaxis protein